MKKFVNKFELPKTDYKVKISAKKTITVRTIEGLNYWLTTYPNAKQIT